MLTDEETEKNKDKMDLRPNIEFVDENLDLYKKGLKQFLKIPVTIGASSFASGIMFEELGNFSNPQVDTNDILVLLYRMPICLIQLSRLEIVSFEWGSIVPVPKFDANGNFNRQADFVPLNEFPRKGDHPSRILIGYTSENGKIIYPSPISPSVYNKYLACWCYQIHVFLHEFFHTIEIDRRNIEERSKIVLLTDNQQFTFQDWWNDFENLILSGNEPQPISSYAANYIDKLNLKTKKADEKEFIHALAEQICESFVAYVLGIASNDYGWTNFQKESFGNKKQLELFQKGLSPAANLKWILIDRLWRAKLLKF